MLAICSRSVSRNKEAVKILRKKFKKIKLNKSNKILSGSILIKFIKDCETIIIGLEKIDKNLLEQCPKLKYIGKYGVGTNNIQFNELKKKKIKIFLQSGVNKRSVSEITLSYIILGLRKIVNTINDVKKRKWPFIVGRELTKRKVGIIGIGNIGKDLVHILKPFKCKIYCNDIKPDRRFYKKNGLKNYSLKKVLKSSEIISIHIPLNEHNYHFISKNEFSLLKKEAILINTSRGGIVDEKALYNFLKKNPLSTTIFDVLKYEPPRNNKLLNLHNFILTPHIAGTTKESMRTASIDCAIKLTKGIKKNYIKKSQIVINGVEIKSKNMKK